MKQPRKRATDRPQRFDPALLTALDHELLADFERRRECHARALEHSNILHHKHPCPACGFPTLDARDDYEICVICLWEDDGSQADATAIGPVNSISLMQHRIDVSGMLRAFLATHELIGDVDEQVRSIKRFEARLLRREAAIDRQDFGASLSQIVPVRPRAAPPHGKNG